MATESACIGDVRHRAEVIEYRVEQHRTILGDRLTGLGASDTAAEAEIVSR